MITTAVTKEQGLESKIRTAIEDHAKELQEKEIKQAVESFERHLRELVGTFAISVASYYDIQMLGPNMVITVKLGDVQRKEQP